MDWVAYWRKVITLQNQAGCPKEHVHCIYFTSIKTVAHILFVNGKQFDLFLSYQSTNTGKMTMIIWEKERIIVLFNFACATQWACLTGNNNYLRSTYCIVNNNVTPGSVACSRLSGSQENEKNCVWKASGGLGRGEAGEPVSISLNSSFRYTSSWYTLWLVNFDSLHQHFRHHFDSRAELTRSTKERGQLCRRVS